MTQGIDPRTPVVVGVGQLLDRTGAAPEPAELAARAAEIALDDAGIGGERARVDTVAMVQVATWRYRDGAVLVAEELGITPELTMYPDHGGNSPQMLMNRLCDRIADGASEIAILCGGESARTSTAVRRTGARPDWTRQSDDVEPGWTDLPATEMFHPVELERSMVSMPENYAVLESAIRAAAGRTVAEHRAFLGNLWAGYSAVAAKNPHAWDQTPHSAADIVDVSDTNWMVAHPYTLHMVSNSRVDMASAAVVCSVEVAERLGIARDNWVFPVTGADCKDPLLSERPSLAASAAIRHGAAAALDAAGLNIGDVAHLDVYSCFPSAVQIACSEIGIDMDRQLTVYGGLGFAGGPWNNPVGHAIAAMVDTLRNSSGEHGFVTANGGNVQKHSFGVYSSRPPTDRFRSANPQALVDAEGQVEVTSTHQGPATLEGWTVTYGKDRRPERALAAYRTSGRQRGWATSGDATVMDTLTGDIDVGAALSIEPDATFTLS